MFVPGRPILPPMSLHATAAGLHVRPAEMMLVSRARDFLAAGPSDAVGLIAHVCQLPEPPRFVADHMAMALLAPWDDFTRGADGRWRLARADAEVSVPARSDISAAD